MATSQQLVVKYPSDVRNITVSFADVLLANEIIGSGTIGSPTPSGITASGLGFTDTSVTLNISSGTDKQSYGIPVTVNTNQGHNYTKIIAVVIDAELSSTYQNQNDVAFNALVGKLEAGTAGLGKANFIFPAGFQANSGVVEWVLLDREGIVYNQGHAFDYQFVNELQGVRVEAQAVIGAPSNMVPTLEGQSYQIRWTLTVNSQAYYSFEQLEVTGPNTVPEGVEDIVELAGTSNLSVYMVSERPFDVVTVEIYKRNEKVMSAVGATATQVANGWQYQALINLQGLQGIVADLEPYTLMWSLSNRANPNYIDRQAGRLFLINPTLMTATSDMRLTLNKACTSILGTADVLFTVPLLLAYLRRGRDAFNGAFGMFTGFTMLNASGPVREYWLKYAELAALRAQFLAEGEKVFNFSGQAISLDVDRTQYYDSMANSIQQQLDNDGKAFKQNLIKKGLIGGDGNVDNPQIGAPGHLGALGITLSPATGWSRFNRFSGGGGRLF